MSNPLKTEPLLQMVADKPFWSVFLSENGAHQEESPSIEDKATWLTSFLAEWSSRVDDLLIGIPADTDDEAPRVELDFDGDVRAETLRLLVESLAHAANTLLAFKKQDCRIDLPEGFSRTANLLLATAEERGVRSKDLTVAQIARRLSAARPHPSGTTQPVTIDEQGRVFDLSGDRLFQFEPEKVLKGQREIRAGQTHSLEEIREAEGRNGR